MVFFSRKVYWGSGVVQRKYQEDSLLLYLCFNSRQVKIASLAAGKKIPRRHFRLLLLAALVSAAAAAVVVAAAVAATVVVAAAEVEQKQLLLATSAGQGSGFVF